MDERQRDEDDQVRAEAVRFMARRLLIWIGPLTVIGILLVALGLPAWPVIVVVAVALVIVVFELDL